MRVSHKLVAQLADMHQPVLVNAQVNKGAKSRHVADGALQHHARLEVCQALHPVGEPGHLEIGAGVASRFFQLAQDIAHGDHAKLGVGEHLRLQTLEPVGTAHQVADALPCVDHDLLHHRVGFRVDTRLVQRVVAATDA